MTKAMTTGIQTPTEPALSDLEHAVSKPSPWLLDAMSVPRHQGSIEVSGCAINYFEWGNVGKPGIIMLHGFLAHSRCFAFIAPFLANDYHVVAFDMSGMGDSGWRDEYSEDSRVAELMGVCEARGLFEHAHKPAIIAHSYGGRIGTATMHRYSQQFSGLIICDLMIMRPSVLLEHAEKFKPPGNQNPNRANRIYPDYDTAKQRFVLAPPQPVEQPELFDFMAYHSLKKVDGGWQWKFDPRVFKRQKGFERVWAETGKEVVSAPGRKAIVCGKDSYLFTDDSLVFVNELVVELKQRHIPIVQIPHARHHLMLDQPMALVTALRTLLAVWAE